MNPTMQPKLKWVEGHYNSSNLSLAGGFIQATAFYATVSRGERPGYQWTCNGFTSVKSKLFPTMEAAQVSCEQFIARRLAMAAQELK